MRHVVLQTLWILDLVNLRMIDLKPFFDIDILIIPPSASSGE